MSILERSFYPLKTHPLKKIKGVQQDEVPTSIMLTRIHARLRHTGLPATTKSRKPKGRRQTSSQIFRRSKCKICAITFPISTIFHQAKARKPGVKILENYHIKFQQQ